MFSIVFTICAGSVFALLFSLWLLRAFSERGLQINQKSIKAINGQIPDCSFVSVACA
jgi:hypothetical protein